MAFRTYTSGTCFEEAIGADLPITSLDALIALAVDTRAVTSRYQQLNAKTARDGRRTLVQLATEVGDAKARDIFTEAALSSSWFKHRSDAYTAGRFIVEKHPDCQTVNDVKSLWTGILELIGGELPAYGPADGNANP